MKRISDRQPASAQTSDVARYLDLVIEAMRPKTLSQIADEAGLPQRNLLSMMRNGQTKLPFERIPALAKALNVNRDHLFRLALAEYQPHINAMLDESGRRVVSRSEAQLLDCWRLATEDRDPDVEPFLDKIRSVALHALNNDRKRNRANNISSKV